MWLFILGITLVLFSSSKGAAVYGCIMITIGMMIVRSDEQIKCHKSTCPGCWKYNH